MDARYTKARCSAGDRRRGAAETSGGGVDGLDHVEKDVLYRAQLEASGNEVQRTAAMIDALVARLRPILVTSLSTLGGVLPTAYGFGGYDDVMGPMSLALGWGIALSSGVTLFLVPALYVTANDWTRRIERQLARHRAHTDALDEAA